MKNLWTQWITTGSEYDRAQSRGIGSTVSQNQCGRHVLHFSVVLLASGMISKVGMTKVL